LHYDNELAQVSSQHFIHPGPQVFHVGHKDNAFTHLLSEH